MTLKPDARFMKMAIDVATKSRELGDYAVGAVIVRNGEVIAKGLNRIKLDKDAILHAEMVAIHEASKKLDSRFLQDCVLYTTHEPCPMCASAAIWARMKGIVFGASLHDMIHYAQKNGTRDWTWRTIDITTEEIVNKGNPKIELVKEFMRKECNQLFHT